MAFNFARLRNAWAAIKNDTSTLANPSAELVASLVGFPTAAGKIVTRETALRVAAFLSGVKTLSNDVSKMPLVLRSRSTVGGRVRTQPAVKNPVYTLLAHCPNEWHTAYQLKWYLVSQLIMSGNCFTQIIRDGKGDILALNPLSAWFMQQRWDRSVPGKPVLYWLYSDGHNTERRFEQKEIWHTSNINFQGSGIEGSAIIVLAKEALSVLMAAEETAGRQFANGLGMGGFISFPVDSGLTEPEAQNVVDRLKKDFSGSQNAGKFTILPGGGTWQKMSFNAQESQLLESRKWNEESVVRLLGGAPLLCKLGLGSQTSTYAATSAQIEDYFQQSLMPLCVSLEESITRDLIAPKDRVSTYAKFDSNVILRGSLRERAETYQIQITSGQLSPNDVNVLEDRDTVDGADWLCMPANTAIFDPTTKSIFIPGQVTDVDGEQAAPQPAAKPAPAVTDEKAKASIARLAAIANSLAERVIRKESKSGGKVDAAFVAEVLNVTAGAAQGYLDGRKSGMVTDADAKSVLVALVTNSDDSRDANGRFATTGGADKYAMLKTPVVHAQMTELYKQAHHTMMPQLGGVQTPRAEYSFLINKDGTVTPVETSGTNNHNTMTITPDTAAIVHTHPLGTDPKPSDVPGGDTTVSKDNGIPNYALSLDALWVANTDGTVTHVADVSWKHNDLVIKWK